ncbi:hypothetical protein AYO44_07155 [Planctomycetaceae bacterium SCGC AG-212-F19]|nr:hypothetical protein AYO44_07155 [Planctomycetaceae bacterium SCGC AG-212-F19]
MPSFLLDRRLLLGTDTACFLLFHPDDLAHRKDDPLDWFDYDFAWQKESWTGRLIGFFTGGDGGYLFRLTNQGLDKREKRYVACSWEFPYRVKHKRIFLDNTNSVPSEERGRRDDPSNPRLKDQWFNLPNGDYRVTVYAIAWDQEPGARERSGNEAAEKLPNYVIDFQKVSDLAKLKRAPRLPQLHGSLGWKPERQFSKQQLPEAADDYLEDSYVLLVEPDHFAVPRAVISVAVSVKLYTAYWGDRKSQKDGELHDQKFVIAPSKELPCAGSLVEVCGGGSSSLEGGPWSYSLSFRGLRLVSVTAHAKKSNWLRATVEPIVRPASKVGAKDLNGLKAEFQSYARTHPKFLKKLRNANFSLERLEAMESPEGVVNWIIEHLELTKKCALIV